MIAKRIHDGETAEQIGISQANYDSRKAVLARFLEQGRPGDFEREYLAWLKADPSGNRHPSHGQATQEQQGGIRGLGDLVEVIAKRTGAAWLAAQYTKKTGRDCGCQARKQKLNRLFPFRS